MSFRRSAFSLIEISIVIIIIGILIAGVTKSGILINRYRLGAANTLTKNSPVASIPDLVSWYETTSDQSLDDTAESDGVAINLSSGFSWYDINPQSGIKNNATSIAGPTYKSDCINNLPCLLFDGTTQYIETTQNMGLTKQLTIFAVFYTTMSTGFNTIIVTRGSGWPVATYFTYAFNASRVLYYRQATNGVNASTSTLLVSKNYISTLIDTNATVTNYINGVVSGTPVNTVSGPKTLNIFTIGAWNSTNPPSASSLSEFFKGGIGELIIFSRALKTEERVVIEKYLSQKWKIAI